MAQTSTQLKIKVIPSASQNRIVGFYNGRLKITITAAPENNKANKGLIKFLAEKLEVSKQSIQITAGEISPYKTIEIEGISQKNIINKLK